MANPRWVRPTWIVLLAVFALICISCQDGDTRRFWVKEPFAIRLPFQSKRRPPQPPYLFIGKAVVLDERQEIDRASTSPWGELPFGRLAIVGDYIVVDHDLRYAPDAERLLKEKPKKGYSIVNIDPPFRLAEGFETLEQVRGNLLLQGETGDIDFLTYDEWEEIDRPRPPLWKRILILTLMLLFVAVGSWLCWLVYFRQKWREFVRWAKEP